MPTMGEVCKQFMDLMNFGIFIVFEMLHSNLQIAYILKAGFVFTVKTHIDILSLFKETYQVFSKHSKSIFFITFYFKVLFQERLKYVIETLPNCNQCNEAKSAKYSM